MRMADDDGLHLNLAVNVKKAGRVTFCSLPNDTWEGNEGLNLSLGEGCSYTARRMEIEKLSAVDNHIL